MMMINDQVIKVDTSVWKPSLSPPLSDVCSITFHVHD